MLTRRRFLAWAGVGAASIGIVGCCGSGLALPKRAKKPNIIYILADDLGYGDLGCYGQKRIKTPHIDQMAAEGMRFTDHYAGSTVCAPSRCCLMTGLHTGHAIVRGNGGGPLRDQDVTVSQRLKQAGYATGIIGKWGLGEEGTTGIPNKKGFDTWFGYLNQRHAHNYYPEFLWRNEYKVALDNEVTPIGGKLGGIATKRVQYSHDLFANEALRFVEDHQDHPFFLYLALTIPHANNEAKRMGMEIPSLGAYADEDWPQPQQGHAAMISRMDSDIGRLFDTLRDLRLDDTTLVIFSSDNGPHREGGADPTFFKSAGPLRGYKRALYEGGIRVPMIARWPGTIAAGTTSGHVSAFWDVLPTCCELAGVDTPAGIDGISFVPTLLGEPAKQKRHPYLYWEFHEQGKRQAVRMGKWKAVKNNIAKSPHGPLEVYDLERDLGETNNIASEFPEITAQLNTYLQTARTQTERWRLP